VTSDVTLSPGEMPSLRTKETLTSIMEPTGATIVITLVPVGTNQNEARDWGGGFDMIWAGEATDTVVSEISLGGELFCPTHSTEQVAAEPCDAGGVQISTWFILAEPDKGQAEVAVTAVAPVTLQTIVSRIL
jgi:hypothetical protein